MEEIFADALMYSRVGAIQYVLSKDGKYERCFVKPRVLDLIGQGYEIKGKFKAGVGYREYKFAEKEQVEKFCAFLCENFNSTLEGISSFMSVSIREYYSSIGVWLKAAIEVTGYILDGDMVKTAEYRTLNISSIEKDTFDKLLSFITDDMGACHDKQTEMNDLFFAIYSGLEL